MEQSKNILLKIKSLFAPGITTSVDDNKKVVAQRLSEVQETFKQHGFVLSVTWRNGKFYVSIYDQDFMNSESGVISTDIAVVTHEWSYLVPTMILSFIEKMRV